MICKVFGATVSRKKDVNFYILVIKSTVEQWLALLPHYKKVLSSTPPSD